MASPITSLITSSMASPIALPTIHAIAYCISHHIPISSPMASPITLLIISHMASPTALPVPKASLTASPHGITYHTSHHTPQGGFGVTTKPVVEPKLG